MTQPPLPVPVFRISMANAAMLSGTYLALATVVEGLRRLTGTRWAERAALSMESFPARMLEVAGVYTPLRDAWLHGEISDLQVRLIYAFTVVLLVFALGLAIASASVALRRLSSLRGG